MPVLKSRQLELLNEWHAAFSHALSNPIRECVLSVIHDQSLPVGRVLKLLDEIVQYPGLYSALNIACFSADCSGPEDAALLDKKEAEIRKLWDTDIGAKSN